MIKPISKDAVMRLAFIVYMVCGMALINGLSWCAIITARAHDDVHLARNLLVVTVTFRVAGLLFLVLLVGNGSMKQAAMNVVVWGYIAGCCTAFVSGWCLFEQATITQDWNTLMSHDYFPLGGILEEGLITGFLLLCLKAVCSLWGVFGSRHEKGVTH